MRRLYIFFALAAVGCESPAPTSFSELDLSPNQSARGPACFAVAFSTQAQVVSPGVFMGTMSGDLVGTVTFRPMGGPRTGQVFHPSGTTEFVVTGGEVSELIGRTLETELENVTVVPPQDPANRTIHGKGRVVAGAQSGNLTFHGILSLVAFPFTVAFEFRGPICP